MRSRSLYMARNTMMLWPHTCSWEGKLQKSVSPSAVNASCHVIPFLILFLYMSQFEGSEPLVNSVLAQRQRPTSDINNSSSISPAHPKVTRSISANQKQRRYSDHGGDDEGGGVVEKPSKVTPSFPALRVLVGACCVGGSCSPSVRISQQKHAGFQSIIFVRMLIRV